MTSIPNDLAIEILSRLPLRSIARFRCVSKRWGSMFRHPYFTDLFLTRSSARPRLLFILEGHHDRLFFFSSRQPHNPYEKPSSLVVDAGFHINFIKCSRNDPRFCGYASGLICFSFIHWKNPKEYVVHAICNPSTRQCRRLPKLKRRDSSKSYLGFDPIDKQFKVLSMGYDESEDHRVLTLGSGDMRWRKIPCPSSHLLMRGGICIKGVLYLFAEKAVEIPLIVCFDVRSEKFKIIDASCFDLQRLPPPKLINYKGKLCGILWPWQDGEDEIGTRVMRMWVLEDVEKHEWSEYVYTLPGNEPVDYVFVAGVTALGEIVLSIRFTTFRKIYVSTLIPRGTHSNVLICKVLKDTFKSLWVIMLTPL